MSPVCFLSADYELPEQVQIHWLPDGDHSFKHRKASGRTWQVHGEVKTPPFTPEGRQEAGMVLRLLQRGERLGMPQSEPLTNVCPSCGALRVRDAEHNWRIMYWIDSDAVLVLEVYAKKTRTIPKAVIDRCKQRLKDYDEVVKAAKKK